MLNYWFTFDSSAFNSNFAYVLLAILLVFLFGGWILMSLAKKQGKERWMLRWLGEIRNSFIWIAVWGLVLLFLTQQNIQVLGAHVWYVLLLVWLVYRGVRLAQRKKYWHSKQEVEEKNKQILRYIRPNKKK